MNGIELLKSEHENIRFATNLIKEECIKVLEGKEVDNDWFTKIIIFCRKYADKHHHGKEEEILFRVMMEELGPVAENLIGNGMLVEHDLGRFHIYELENALKAYKLNPSTENKLLIITNAAEYASLLNRHMDKEDIVVYEFAERSLDDLSKSQIEIKTSLFETQSTNKEVMEILDWLYSK